MATFTPKLNLEQQGGGERASLAVLNTNLGKIDDFAGKVGFFGNVGSISSLSALQAAISSAVGTDYTPRRIMLMFSLGSAFGVFTATGQNHLCQIDVTQESRWNVLIEQHSNIGNIYRGTNAGGTWSWDKLALNSQINTLNSQINTLNSNKANSSCFKSSEAVFAPTSVGNQTETVTFPTAFENVPVVMAMWKDTATVLAHMSFLTITSVSKTGFTIATERKNASAGWRFAWFAFSPNG